MHERIEASRICLAVALCAAFACRPAFADQAALFATQEPLVMEIRTDLQRLCPDSDAGDCPDMPAVVSYRDSIQKEHRIDSALQIRGRWQQDTAACSLPALFIVFERTAVADTVFEEQEVLPLTTHCRPAARYEQYLLKEYLAHRIYNVLADKSLKVRLARITYHDTSGQSEPIERHGFFSEHFRSLAERYEAEVWSPEDLFDHMEADPLEIATLAVFQYMIGNTDWSILAGHNITFIRGSDWVTPVPFDLDFSGLVNAVYAGPPPGLQLRSVTQRLYRGLCRPDTDWSTTFDRFTNRRTAIFDLAQQVPGLNRSHRRRVVTYLESFYAILDSPRRRERNIVSRCRG